MRGLYEYGANKSDSYHVYKGPGKCLNGEKFALSRLPLTRDPWNRASFGWQSLHLGSV